MLIDMMVLSTLKIARELSWYERFGFHAYNYIESSPPVDVIIDVVCGAYILKKE
jgi:hypothetical protein